MKQEVIKNQIKLKRHTSILEIEMGASSVSLGEPITSIPHSLRTLNLTLIYL